ncbi:hypothetical protein [Bacillus toyonensis]|uniref:hypothetical protein n=1 Tax=Bacillus toyonensis TaxID=155322 RepID=UPI0015D4D2CA|nr:hypothetical protein [Bacillus toyonensis]
MNNIKPTATEPWRQLVEVLRAYENETLQFQIESKDKSLYMLQTIPSMCLGENENFEEISHLIAISSDDIKFAQVNITLQKEDIISVESIYTPEVVEWRKDGFKIEYKNDITFTFNVLID